MDANLTSWAGGGRREFGESGRAEGSLHWHAMLERVSDTEIVFSNRTNTSLECRWNPPHPQLNPPSSSFRSHLVSAEDGERRWWRSR